MAWELYVATEMVKAIIKTRRLVVNARGDYGIHAQRKLRGLA